MHKSVPDTYRALVYTGNQAALVKPLPLITDIGPDKILVRVRSVGLNPKDWKSFDGVFPLAPNTVLGSDAAGDVVKVGSDVKHFKVGDHVACLILGPQDNGAFAEYTTPDAITTIKLPDNMSYNEGASFTGVHLTAVQGLYAHLKVPWPSDHISSLEDTILVWGGSTAVGHHVIQLAALSGLRVFAVASASSHEALQTLGAAQCFDYHDKEVLKKIETAAGVKAIKYGFDCVSQDGTSEMVMDALSSGGKLITLLPQEGIEKHRNDIVVKCIIIGLVFVPWPAMGYPLWTEDRPFMSRHITEELPLLLDGWVEGEGSPRYKPQRLRVLKAGLENIIGSYDILRKGEYGREKLVHPIC